MSSNHFDHLTDESVQSMSNNWEIVIIKLNFRWLLEVITQNTKCLSPGQNAEIKTEAMYSSAFQPL